VTTTSQRALGAANGGIECHARSRP
jgi:hypothetical protein